MSVTLREKKLKGGKVSLYLDIYENGKRQKPHFLKIHVNKKHPTEQDKKNRIYAQQLCAKWQNEQLIEGHGVIDHEKQKTDFITWFEHKFIPTKLTNGQNYNSLLLQIKAFQNGKPLQFRNINVDWVKNLQTYMLTKMENNGAWNYMKLLSVSLKAGVKQNFLKNNPYTLLDKSEKLKRQDSIMVALTIEELSQMANCYPLGMHPQIKQIFLFSAFTGLRWCDANCLKWSEIVTKNIEGVERWFIHFDQSKTKVVEYLPLSPQAVSTIKERIADKANEPESEHVFPEVLETNHKTRKKWAWVKYWLKKWAEMANIKKRIHYHCARHTFATNVLEHSPSGDLYTVSKLLGHTSIIATQIYAKVRDKRKTEAVEALPMLEISSKNNENTPVVQIPTIMENENFSLVDLLGNPEQNRKENGEIAA